LGCGNLLWDANDTWIKGFLRKVATCDALHAEIWGMYVGLELALKDDISQLCVESYSIFVIDMVTNKAKIWFWSLQICLVLVLVPVKKIVVFDPCKYASFWFWSLTPLL